MAESKTIGPIQVATGTVAEINAALAIITEHLDYLYGLRGEHRTYDTLVYKDEKTGDTLHGFGSPTG